MGMLLATRWVATNLLHMTAYSARLRVSLQFFLFYPLCSHILLHCGIYTLARIIHFCFSHPMFGYVKGKFGVPVCASFFSFVRVHHLFIGIVIYKCSHDIPLRMPFKMKRVSALDSHLRCKGLHQLHNIVLSYFRCRDVWDAHKRCAASLGHKVPGQLCLILSPTFSPPSFQQTQATSLHFRLSMSVRSCDAVRCSYCSDRFIFNSLKRVLDASGYSFRFCALVLRAVKPKGTWSPLFHREKGISYRFPDGIFRTEKHLAKSNALASAVSAGFHEYRYVESSWVVSLGTWVPDEVCGSHWLTYTPQVSLCRS